MRWSSAAPPKLPKLCSPQPGLSYWPLVTDVDLPGEMTGVELAEYAKRKFPKLNVVMVSGQGASYIPQNTRFFLKPYRLTDLLDAVFN